LKESPRPDLSSVKGVVVLDNADATLMTRVKWDLAITLTDKLGAIDIQVHDHRILPASDDNSFTGDIRPGVDIADSKTREFAPARHPASSRP
jgi:hypothetical protein